MSIRKLVLLLHLCVAPTGSVLLAQDPAPLPANTTVTPGATVAHAREVREAHSE